MRWRITKVWERIGKHGVHFGRIGPRMKLLADEFAFAGDDAVATCRGRSRRGAPRPGFVDGRILFSKPAGAGRYSGGAFLRLPDECGQLSEVAGVDAKKSAEAVGDLGEIRIVVRSVRAGSVSTGRAECGGAYRRWRSL